MGVVCARFLLHNAFLWSSEHRGEKHEVSTQTLTPCLATDSLLASASDFSTCAAVGLDDGAALVLGVHNTHNI